MRHRRFRLFRIENTIVSAHVSWLPLMPLLLWSLAQRVFPFLVPELPQPHYWWMAVAGMIGLILSVIAREVMQVLVAGRLRMPFEAVTLFFFGGIAEARDARHHGKEELMTAVAGVLVSTGLGALLLVFLLATADSRTHLSIIGVGFFLAGLNWLLGLVNLVPAYPLSGGRLLRAVVLRWVNDGARATRLAAATGSALAVAAICLGILAALLWNHDLAGLWLILIGLLVLSAAMRRYR